MGFSPGFRIVALCTLAAIAYGIVHDQVTVRVSLEYFTIGHPRIVRSEDPTVLGLAWGVAATWWVGVGLGLLLAVAARAGSRPRVEPRALVRPVLVLLLVMGACALVAALVGRAAGEREALVLIEPYASRVPRERHVAFLTAGAAHAASYAVGALGGLVLAIRTWRRRGRARGPAV